MQYEKADGTMWSIDFGHPSLLWAVPFGAMLALVGVWLGAYLSRRAGQKFWRAALPEPARGLLLGRGLLAAAGVALLLFAAALPRWGYEVGVVVRSGRDLVLVVDVSRSMLAEDVPPSRLERCRTDLLDLVDAAQKRGGCRIGLVAFAGDGRKLSPLTESFGYVRRQIERLSPSVASRGGSYIESGLRVALKLFDTRTENYRDIILVSDGDDFGSDLTKIINDLKGSGVVVHSILRGDDRRGAEIPVETGTGTRRYLRYRGEIVRTVANGELLRRVAEATGGVYVPARIAPLDVARFFDIAIWRRPKNVRSEDLHQKPTERFVWFLAPALFLLLMETIMSFTGVAQRRWDAPARSVMALAIVLGGLVLITGLGAGPAGRERAPRPDRRSAERLLRRALDAYRAGNREQTGTLLQLATNEDPSWWLSLYELGAFLAEERLWGEALHRFLQAREQAPLEVHPLINYSAGTAAFRQAEQALVAGEPPKAVELLERADALLGDALAQALAAPGPTSGALRDVLTGLGDKPNNLDEFERRIRWNLEMTRRLLAKLRQQAQQSTAGQQQPQPQEGDNRQEDSQRQQQPGEESERQDSADADQPGRRDQQQEQTREPTSPENDSTNTQQPPNAQREQQERKQGERLEQLEGQRTPAPPRGGDQEAEQRGDALNRLRAEMQRLMERDRARLQRSFRVYVPRAEKDW